MQRKTRPFVFLGALALATVVSIPVSSAGPRDSKHGESSNSEPGRTKRATRTERPRASPKRAIRFEGPRTPPANARKFDIGTLTKPIENPMMQGKSLDGMNKLPGPQTTNLPQSNGHYEWVSSVDLLDKTGMMYLDHTYFLGWDVSGLRPMGTLRLIFKPPANKTVVVECAVTTHINPDQFKVRVQTPNSIKVQPVKDGKFKFAVSGSSTTKVNIKRADGGGWKFLGCSLTHD